MLQHHPTTTHPLKMPMCCVAAAVAAAVARKPGGVVFQIFFASTFAKNRWFHHVP